MDGGLDGWWTGLGVTRDAVCDVFVFHFRMRGVGCEGAQIKSMRSANQISTYIFVLVSHMCLSP